MELDYGQAKKQQLDPKKKKFNKIREYVNKRGVKNSLYELKGKS